MRYRLTRQASQKATTVPELGRGLSRRSTDRKTPGKSPPFRDKRGRHQPDFTGSGGPLAIDVKWQLLRPDDGKIYPSGSARERPRRPRITDAQASLTHAQQNLLDAGYNYLIALDRLDYAVGVGEVAHVHRVRSSLEGLLRRQERSRRSGAGRGGNRFHTLPRQAQYGSGGAVICDVEIGSQ